MGVSLLLDPAIRDWVLVPIVVVMFLVAITRHFVTKMLSAHAPVKAQNIHEVDAIVYLNTRNSGAEAEWGSKLAPHIKKPTDMKVLRRNSLLGRARRLRGAANLLPASSWQMRAVFLGDKSTGALSLQLPTQAELGVQGALANNPMMDPSNMMDMMKKQFGFMVPQMLIMGWVSYFFSGFIVMQLPFQWLTPAFKPMLQRGLESLGSLDMSYVSSLSWYFLCVFGMSKITSLILGEANVADDTALMQQQMAMQTGGMAGGQAGQPPDVSKLYNDERDYIELVQHRWALEDAEQRLLAQKL